MSEYSVREARAKISYIIDTVSSTGESVIITKSGQPKVMITSITRYTDRKKERADALNKSKGIWKNKKLSERVHSRYGKIFN